MMRLLVLAACLLSVAGLHAKITFSLVNKNAQYVIPGEQFRVDIACANQSNESAIVIPIIKVPEGIELVQPDLGDTVAPGEARVISYYFRSVPGSTTGKRVIHFQFAGGKTTFALSQEIFIQPRTSIVVQPTSEYIENGRIRYTIANNSNHPISFENKALPAHSKKEFVEKVDPAKVSTHNLFYRSFTFTYDGKTVFDTNLVFRVKKQKQKQDTEYQVFPINWGIMMTEGNGVFATTPFLKGGGVIDKDHKLIFNFSAPIYPSPDIYPYLSFSLDAAVFYLDYTYKNIRMRGGDAGFDSNPILFYRYGRGYELSYIADSVKAGAGYVSDNKFFNDKQRDLFTFVKGSAGKSTFYYNTDSKHTIGTSDPSYVFGQNFGFQTRQDVGETTFATKFDIYNTDFKLEKSFSGMSLTENVSAKGWNLGVFGSYLGENFSGNTSNQKTVGASVLTKRDPYSGNLFLSGAYNDYRTGDDLNKIVQAESKFTIREGETIWDARANYSSYANTLTNRKNYGAGVGFQTPLFGKHAYFNLASGLAYSHLVSDTGAVQERYTSDTNGALSLRFNRISAYIGANNQMRDFSNIPKPVTRAFFGLNSKFDANNLDINVNVGNQNLKYNFGTSLAFTRKTGSYTLEGKYLFNGNASTNMQLQAMLASVKQRILVRLTMHTPLYFEKRYSPSVKVYDQNTNVPLSHGKVFLENESFTLDPEGSHTFDDIEAGMNHLAVVTHDQLNDIRRYITLDTKSHKTQKIYIDYRGNIAGFISIKSSLPRASVNNLILTQPVVAEAVDGKRYFGKIDSTGIFTIPNVPVGEYKITIEDDLIPANIHIGSRKVNATYMDFPTDVKIKVKY